jgi:carbonic anhydrase/acetyltransferase-like protein (isoleucine patch superfamily)
MKSHFKILSILSLLLFLTLATCQQPANNDNIQVDPLADVHPSVILEGNIKIGPYTQIGAGTILTGDITIGHHSLIQTNCALRGTIKIGNCVHIYDNCNFETGRPANVGTTLNMEADQLIIGDSCWVNHGSVMHGTQMGVGSAVGVGSACDYNTRIGKGAILANGSATGVNQIIPDNAFAEGVPAVVKKTNINEEFRREYFGVSPKGWIEYEAPQREREIKEKLGIE